MLNPHCGIGWCDGHPTDTGEHGMATAILHALTKAALVSSVDGHGMKNPYNVRASYRCRFDPKTGVPGPPSRKIEYAMKGSIWQEQENDSK